jgi:hypothetical protein
MISAGNKLYNSYVEANLSEDIGVDDWNDLTDLDQRVWEFFAELLNQKEN